MARKKWHVKANGEMGVCTAQDESSCPFGGEEGVKHFTTKKAATAYAEERIAEQHGNKGGLKKNDDTQGRAERITSLRTELDPNGELNHSQDLFWDPNASVTGKVMMLAFHYGGQVLDAHKDNDEQQKEILGNAILEWSQNQPDNAHIPRGDESQIDHVEITLIGEGKDREVLPIETRLVADVTSKTPIARADRYDEDGNRIGPPVLIARGVKHTGRSIFAKKALSISWSPDWDGPQEEYQSTYGHILHRPTNERLRLSNKYYQIYRNFAATYGSDRVQVIDGESLIGMNKLRNDIKTKLGLDISSYPSTENQTIGDRLDDLASEETWANSQAKYEHNARHGKIATAFTDKMHTSKEAAQAAQDTTLHKHFNHIEFDEDMDLEKLPQLESEIDVAMRSLPKTSVPVAGLRVRKLGKYRDNTLGVYSPVYNAIVLDDGKATRNGYSGMSAFVHEYAHHIDHTMEDGKMMSMSNDFKPVLKAVTTKINADDSQSDSRRKYLATPTEVFSRCFEWWTVKKLGTKSSLTATEESYDNDEQFAAIRENGELVDKVMSKLFPDMKGFDSLDKNKWNK